MVIVIDESCLVKVVTYSQAEVVNQVMAGVRETLADSGVDQALLNRYLSLGVCQSNLSQF